MAQLPIAVTEDLIFNALKFLGGRGTRDDVEAVVAHNKLFSEAEVSRIGNDISREMSMMATGGLLDDSGRFEGSQKRLYSIPERKLPPRKSKGQLLQEKIENLQEDLEKKSDQVETLMMFCRKLREQAEGFGYRPCC